MTYENELGQLPQYSEAFLWFTVHWCRCEQSCMAFVVTLRHGVDDRDDKVNYHDNHNFLIEPRQPAWFLQQYIIFTT